MVLPRYGEVIWNKTHRYLGKQLNDNRIVLTGLLKIVKNLRKLCKKCVERQIEKRKTVGSDKSQQSPRRRNV